jgi:hypothetical protein
MRPAVSLNGFCLGYDVRGEVPERGWDKGQSQKRCSAQNRYRSEYRHA